MQHDVAQLRLGMMLIVGVGAAKSVNEGLLLLRGSAENGNRVAEALIQDLFDAGDVRSEDAVRIVAGIRRVLDEGEKQTLETLRRSLELLHKKPEPVKSVAGIKRQSEKKRIDIVKAVTGQKTEVKPTASKTTERKSRQQEKLQSHDEAIIPGGNLFHWYLNIAN